MAFIDAVDDIDDIAELWHRDHANTNRCRGHHVA